MIDSFDINLLGHDCTATITGHTVLVTSPALEVSGWYDDNNTLNWLTWPCIPENISLDHLRVALQESGRLINTITNNDKGPVAIAKEDQVKEHDKLAIHLL